MLSPQPFQTLAELQFESGYPYIVFEDTVNANPIKGKITMSNLCSEILQVSEASPATARRGRDDPGSRHPDREQRSGRQRPHRRRPGDPDHLRRCGPDADVEDGRHLAAGRHVHADLWWGRR